MGAQLKEYFSMLLHNNCCSLQELRQIVRELDRATRVQIANLNRVHANPTGPGK